MIRKLSFLLVAGTLAAAPGIAGHQGRADSAFANTYAELAMIDGLAHEVRDPYLRYQLQLSVERAEASLAREEAIVQRRIERARHRDRGTARPDRGPPARNYLSFDEAKQLIEGAYFESDKVRTAQHLGAKARLTTEEAKALADLMYYESGKKDALIALYPAVVDKHRYMLAFDILYFASTREEVLQALGI